MISCIQAFIPNTRLRPESGLADAGGTKINNTVQSHLHHGELLTETSYYSPEKDEEMLIYKDMF